MKQQTKEWLEFRRTRVGASDAAAILGISPWTTRNQLLKQKANGVEKASTPEMRHGLESENAARSLFQSMTGIGTEQPDCLISPTLPWQIASLDGLSSDGLVGLEIKTSKTQELYEMAKSNIIPPHYMAQIQHQWSVVPGMSKHFYMVYDSLVDDAVIIETKKDQDYIDHMVKLEKEFWLELMDTLPTQEMFDEEWQELANELIHIRSFKSREKEITDRLVKLAEGRDSKGFGVSVSRTVRKGSVDYSKIPQLTGIDLELYRGEPTECWTVRSS
jgi:putative phage-type endonuclease